jgi:integrase/recombinase XerC
MSTLDSLPLIEEFAEYLRLARYFTTQTVKCYQTDLCYFGRFLLSTQAEQQGPDGCSEQPGLSRGAVRAVALAAPSEQLPLLAARPAEIRHYLAHLDQQGCSSATIARKLASLRTFYKFLVKRNYLKVNPAAGISTPRMQKTPPQLLHKQQIQQLLAVVPAGDWLGARNKAMLHTLYCGGLKVGELVSLNVQDVDFVTLLMHIHTDHKRRTVAISTQALQDIERYLRLRSQRANSRGEFAPQALFVNRCGKRLSDRSIRREVQLCLAAAGLDTACTAGTLRHSFAAHKRAAGLDLPTLQKLLGYLSLASVRLYAQI